jgi:hypothetical protein
MRDARPWLGIVGRLGVACLLSAASALAADRFVAATGDDAGNDCLSSAAPCATLTAAIGQAASGDTIKVAAGVYRENVVLDAPTVLAVQGGWSSDFSVRDPAADVTTIDGRRVGSVFDLAAGAGVSIVLTLDGLVVARGYRTTGGAGVGAATTADGVIALTVNDCVVERNQAYGFGAGIRASSPPPGAVHLSVSSSRVRKNRGGGLAADGAVDALLVDSTFERNRLDSAVTLAGGGSLTLQGCTLDKNATPGEGGGLHVVSAGPASVTIADCVFTRNRATLGSAGATVGSLQDALAITITNSVFRANRALRFAAGGINVFATLTGSVDLALTNSTIVHNPGGGLILTPEGTTVTAALTNTILRGNAAGPDVDLQLNNIGGTLVVDADHDILGERAGVGTFNDLGGNLDVDPLLASPVDVHLTPASPAVDAGTCTGAPATDFEGDPRPTGAGCDIGADELAP